MHYEPTVESLREHPVPDWYHDAKLGIFIHWGLFAVPGFAPRLAHVSDAFTQHYPLGAVMTPYTEWYENAIRVPESPSAAHHAEHWGGRPYGDFRSDFAGGLAVWDPGEWARLFRRAGARYVVLVSKHHDGYCLWPSKVRNPNRADWSTERDVVGELAAAVRAEGLRFGLYYSGGIDWSWNTTPVRTLVEFVGSMPGGDYPHYAEAQVRELIERYAPDVLWNDISWPGPLPSLLQLFCDYYRAVPDGVVNDRWMHRNWLLALLTRRPVQKIADTLIAWRIRRDAARGRSGSGVVPPVPAHCDFRTPEYTSFEAISERKWEATRGMSPSFGFNRADREEDYEDPAELVRSFIDTVSKNGNLLLNVGPTGEEASIPSFQRHRLELLGDWLAAEGEAIYATRPWVAAEAQTDGGVGVRFTRRGDSVYAIVLGPPAASGPARIAFALPADLPVAPRIRALRAGAVATGGVTGRTVSLEVRDEAPEAPARAFALCGGDGG